MPRHVPLLLRSHHHHHRHASKQAGEADEAVAVARSAVGAVALFVANTHASIRVWSMDNGVLLIKFS